MSQETEKPVVYRNGFLPKSQSKMHQVGRAYAENPPQVDYSNSHRSRRELPDPPNRSLPGTPIAADDGRTDGFFKATLKQAVKTAVNDVIDPAARNFFFNTIVSMAQTLAYGENARRVMPPVLNGQTPYRQISSGQSSQAPAALPPARMQLSTDDRRWQQFEKCHTPTDMDDEEAKQCAFRIMRKMLETLRLKGRVTLADYYHAFGYRSEFVDEGWGWTEIPKEQMYTMRYPDGYHVFMPKLEELDSELRR